MTENKFNSLRNEDIDSACNEMGELYEFIQKHLSETGRVKDGKVKLVRRLRDFEIEEVADQHKVLNKIYPLSVNTPLAKFSIFASNTVPNMAIVIVITQNMMDLDKLS